MPSSVRHLLSSTIFCPALHPSTLCLTALTHGTVHCQLPSSVGHPLTFPICYHLVPVSRLMSGDWPAATQCLLSTDSYLLYTVYSASRLSAVCHLLSLRQPSTVSYLVFTVWHLLSIVCRLPSTICCLLCGVCHLLLTVCSQLSIICPSLSSVGRSLSTVQLLFAVLLLLSTVCLSPEPGEILYGF